MLEMHHTLGVKRRLLVANGETIQLPLNGATFNHIAI